MKVCERDGEWWDGPVIEVTSSWRLDYRRYFEVEVRGVILESHDWPLPVGAPFTCYAASLEFVDP